MRYARWMLWTVMLVACAESRSPLPSAPPAGEASTPAGAAPGPGAPGAPPPEPGTTQKAFVWGMVITNDGACVAGASVRVVRGQLVGATLEQEMPCDAWAYSGGFLFEKVTPGEAMTIVASAPGYGDLTRTIEPTLGPQTAYLFALAPR